MLGRNEDSLSALRRIKIHDRFETFARETNPCCNLVQFALT
jgi:hypothetical protein